MKILLLGHRGYLGSYLYENLDVDILDGRNVYNNGKKYDYVINCIGKPDPDYCEQHILESNYSNWLVIDTIKSYYSEAKIINFSSYYVYDDAGLCNEESNTTYKYAYMRQNLNGEKLIENGVSFRLGKLFGHKYHQKGKLIEHIINSNTDIILDSVLFNPTSLIQILKVIKFELGNNTLNGIYNLSNLGYASPYDYGVLICDTLRLKKNIVKIDRINKSFNNYGRFLMDVSKLNNIYPLIDWKIDFIDYLNQFK
jgi:dTDP-4-dehydrorhamnose reductase